MIDPYTQRNVKRWRDGDMRKRWTAAGMLVAEQQFRRIIGYRNLAKLVIAIERHADRVKLGATTKRNGPRTRHRPDFCLVNAIVRRLVPSSLQCHGCGSGVGRGPRGRAMKES